MDQTCASKVEQKLGQSSNAAYKKVGNKYGPLYPAQQTQPASLMFKNEEKREISTRVNSARLSNYLEQTVRLPCKVLRMTDERTLVVEASDGGQVTVVVPLNATVQDTYVEIVGKVTGAAAITMLSSIALGSNLDMKLVNDTIELIHDPRFYNKMFR